MSVLYGLIVGYVCLLVVTGRKLNLGSSINCLDMCIGYSFSDSSVLLLILFLISELHIPVPRVS